MGSSDNKRKYTIEVHPPRLETESTIVEVICKSKNMLTAWYEFKRLLFQKTEDELQLIEQVYISDKSETVDLDAVGLELVRGGHAERVVDQNQDLIVELRAGNEYSKPDSGADFYHRKIDFVGHEARTSDESQILEANAKAGGKDRTAFSTRFRRDGDTLILAEIVDVDAKSFENLELTTVADSALERGHAQSVYDQEGELVLEYRFGDRYQEADNDQ